jgi:sugar phosphate isomerase/epimerase
VAIAEAAAAEGRSEARLIRAGIDVVTARPRAGETSAGGADLKRLPERALGELNRRRHHADLGCQADVYWVQVGGKDPAAFIREQGRRIRTLHLKDEAELGGVETEVGLKLRKAGQPGAEGESVDDEEHRDRDAGADEWGHRHARNPRPVECRTVPGR